MNYIGILTVNNLGYLKETINSIKTKYDHKIIIVDNGSGEETRNWVRDEWQGEKILNTENVGVSRGWNQVIHWALSHNDCETIFLPNNDIVLHHECMDFLIEDLLEVGYEGISGINIGAMPIMLESFGRSNVRYNPAMNFSCFGLTPKTIKRIGLFDEQFLLAYFEDNDYHLRMNNEGIKNACDSWAGFTHYGSRSIKEGGVKHEPYFTMNRNYFKKKWGFIP